MPIMIDGHNLIPKISGIDLSDLDDEMRLLDLLQEYSRLRRRGHVECYFDRAPAGHPRRRKFGSVQVQFARQGQTADFEIEARLKQLGRQARNWTVVSSDQRVRQAARAVGARDIRSEDFALELRQTLSQKDNFYKTSEEPPMDQDDIEHWLKIFRTPRSNDTQ
jgi:uncharacterized protein